MGRIRNFSAEDIASIADLWLRVFRRQERSSPPSLRRYFQEVFLENPWSGSDLMSMVYEENDRPVAFLGVLPRPMIFQGQPIMAAVSSQFMVDTARHRGLAGVELMRKFLAGPQDLSFTDGASDGARRLWDAARGELLTMYGSVWTRVLRPGAYLLDLAKTKKRLRPVAEFCAPAGWAIDRLARLTSSNPYAVARSEAIGQMASEEVLLQCISELPAQWLLKPCYDLRSIQWLLRQSEQAGTRGKLHKIVVLNKNNERLGWYVYYAKAGGVSKVLQVGGKERGMSQVIRHLLYHAWCEGSAAVSGRLEPRFVRELSRERCRFEFPDLFVLAHSRQPEILSALHRGSAFLTRLDGEWWMRFHEEAWT